jgi:hypothetical protein
MIFQKDLKQVKNSIENFYRNLKVYKRKSQLFDLGNEN